MSKTIGLISGGQLGRMLTVEAKKLGFKVLVLDPTPNCPAAQVGAKQIAGSWKDVKLIREVYEKSDFLTFETEHLDISTLEGLDETKINPKISTIKLIQNKYEQKKFLVKNGIKVVDFDDFASLENAENKLKEWGRIYLKSKLDAYDGRGNWLIKDSTNLENVASFENLNNFYIEKSIKFDRELAVMVAKDMNGNLLSYPVTETVHKRSICVETYAPANIPDFLAKKATELAEKTVAQLDGSGMYGVEMFLTDFDQILVNEIAPRVHNSGHWTMDACETSQFEQHIRAITGMELGSTEMREPTAVMINILGERDGPTKVEGLKKVEAIEGVKVHIYGKSPTKTDRKMGHINAVGATIEEALGKAQKVRSMISI